MVYFKLNEKLVINNLLEVVIDSIQGHLIACKDILTGSILLMNCNTNTLAIDTSLVAIKHIRGIK